MAHRKTLLFAAVFAVVGVVSLGANAQAETDTETRAGLREEQKVQIEARKAELKAKLEAAKEARMNKLEGKRLEICEKRQTKVNNILARGTEQSRKHLGVFQKIEEKVKQFYVDKNLSAEGYDAAVTNADEKEAAAVAAIEASTETTFDCATTDGAKPGDAVRELMKTRHEALKAYRTAVKDLILVVKKGHGQQQNSTTTETESETETTTEGEQ